MWYINDTIIPVLRVTRGNKYTFLVYGGRNKNEASSYHPFYLTSTNDGGRIANNETVVSFVRIVKGMYVFLCTSTVLRDTEVKLPYRCRYILGVFQEATTVYQSYYSIN